MIRAVSGCFGLLFACTVLAQQQAIEATTTAGDKVRLLPDGRWEYVDPKKQAAMPKPATPAAAVPAATPSAPAAAQTAPAAAGPTQGGLFGFGRTIQPGDPDYNRGSLNPRAR
jgi:hypothetical protein